MGPAEVLAGWLEGGEGSLRAAGGLRGRRVPLWSDAVILGAGWFESGGVAGGRQGGQCLCFNMYAAIWAISFGLRTPSHAGIPLGTMPRAIEFWMAWLVPP